MVAAAALAMGGCASTAQPEAGGGSGASPLKVALFVNATGPLPSGEENAGPVVQAWAKSVNATGGVAGHPVEIVVADTKGDAPTATTAVRRIVHDDSVVAA